MATINGTTSSNTHWTFKLEATPGAGDILTNTSSLTVAVYVGRAANVSASYMEYPRISGSVTCDGTSRSFSYQYGGRINFSSGQWLKVGEVSFSGISHSDDGTKTVSLSASFTCNIIPKSGSASGSVALNAIPRASTLAISSGTLGVAQTITADRKASRFTHTLVWASGQYSGTIAENSSATSWTFNPPMNLANNAPNGTSVSCDFTLTTLDGTTVIGTSRKTVLMAIPDSVKPSCTMVCHDPVGHAGTFGSYVQGKSNLAVAITATQAYGSPIVEYKTSFDGHTYTAAEFTTDAILTSGNVPISVTVKDGRGRSHTLNDAVNVLAYADPAITLLKVHRCDEDGTENISGTFCEALFSFDVNDLSGANNHSACIRYKRTSEDSYTELVLTGTQPHTMNQSVIFPADDGSSYHVTLQVSDSFRSTQRTVVLSTGFTLMHFTSSGRGLAIGKVAEGDGLDVSMDARFRGNVMIGDTLISDYIGNIVGQYVGSGLKNDNLSGISTYPNEVGAYRVTGTLPPGMPAGAQGYGCLLIADGGTYRMHLYVASDNILYVARTTENNEGHRPPSWMKYSGTSVAART